MKYLNAIYTEVDKLSKSVRYTVATMALLVLTVLVMSKPNILGFILQIIGASLGVLLFATMVRGEINRLIHWISSFINEEKSDGNEGVRESIDSSAGEGVDDIGSPQTQAENPQDR